MAGGMVSDWTARIASMESDGLDGCVRRDGSVASVMLTVGMRCS